MHQVEAGVDVVEGQLVGDQIVDVDLAVHVPIDDSWHVGASFGAAKGGSFPHPASDQLEGPGGNLLAGAGDADDDADAPTPVSAFERLPHGLDVADAFEAEIGPALGQVHQIGDEVARDLLRVDEMGHPEFFGESSAFGIEVDPDDHIGADHAAALDDVQSDPAEAKDHDVGAGVDLGRVDHRADPGGDAAANVADLVERRVLADLCHRDLG